MNVMTNIEINFTLRALQLIFAIIVMGTDGYAIHVFRGHTIYEHFEFGSFYEYYGVPDAWGFLIFCAAWTVMGVFFFLIARVRYADSALISYTRFSVEAVAFFSWLAGFIAVAVNIGSNDCPLEENRCGLLKAATVFGALEWLLFLITTIKTFKLVFNCTSLSKTSKTSLTPSAV
ncbi:uncharacterized protein TrAFT101_008146 [Trichoderma asperellum]|uniref:MARVEL domain-containing protein n=1 Tax=Trichoderma asperellum (strain ATCC 204424 / CBS 433.97 / NBRC 101777) TaxID=1042311 RepID=A0A2T3YQI2_TRIA4|nr:hypothetical protein M441DRAFT_32471 [Trichoderma asperellum CBS 433.97]PTB34831.1 hypothetical protein M441DRAFT_32471 [Trichoderma asperellum CBS 433.97]UKZ93225.1 hypothetical protein TrAFT101_008146 [Trichoderma asperellum]